MGEGRCISLFYGRAAFFCVFLHISPLFWTLIYVTTEHRVDFSVLRTRLALVVNFIYSVNSVYMSIPASQFIFPALTLVSIYVFSMSVSISALQIRSSVPFF